MALLVVAEPQTFVAVVVHEIEGSLAMLLVLEPLAFVFLAVGEGVGAIAVALSLGILTVVGVAVAIEYRPFTVGFPRHHLSFVLPHKVALLDFTGTQSEALGITQQRQRKQ